MRGRGRIYAARSLPADSRLPYTRGPGGIVSQRAAAAYSPLIRPCGATFPPKGGEGKGYLYPVICRAPSRLLQQQRLDLHAAQRGL